MGNELQRFRQVNSVSGEVVEAEVDLSALAEQLVAQASGQGIELTGPNGLLTGLTRQVLQSALEAELNDHLGFERYGLESRGAANNRNGSLPKTERTAIDELTGHVHGDRAGAIHAELASNPHCRL